MQESFPTNRMEPPRNTPKQEVPKKEREIDAPAVEEFLNRETELLSAYGLKGDITLERGNGGWAFDFQNRKLIYDPNFFIERGYNLQETLFATTHELMAHYGELLRDPELILKEAKRYSAKEHLHLLYNIFEDVLGNRRIVAELPFLKETRETLYREKMFPQTDYTDKASHVQFTYGFIRQMMVSGEAVQLGLDAQTALDTLRSFGSEKIDILDLVTTPTIDPKDRFRIMRTIVEPIYRELYEKDLEEEKKNGKKDQGQVSPTDTTVSDKPQQGQGSGQEKRKWWQRKRETPQEGKGKEEKPGNEGDKKTSDRAAKEAAQKKFKEQYKTYHDSHPEPITYEEEKQIKKMMEEIVAKKGGAPTLEQNILEEWAREHGVNAEDVLGYRKEYAEIAPLVAELREVFKQIISRRLKERWKFSPQLETEGEELSEDTLVESSIESRMGGEPHAFRELEKHQKEQKGYGMLDMSLVNDLSGSMSEGGKLEMDRKSKLLFLESLADFQKEIKQAEYESGIVLGLQVRTETRAFGDFGDTELKELSPELSEKDRVGIWKKMHKAGGGTPDYLSLDAVLKSITQEQEKELREKTRRKVVVVLSDGESQDASRVQGILRELRSKGVIVLGLGMTESGGAVKETYKPDAEVIADIKTLPQAVQNVILKYTQDL
ncbi:MAG: VWA domain-containing protein [Patescibacteria group bacterium]|nr:VWA domain-containing protein [Patescibacteria group bacterium]MDE2438136.1 VWA domain-containing protein [Patescibacteria group bacterium]